MIDRLPTGRRVLVVDDDESDRALVIRAMRKLDPGTSVTTAATAREALDRLAEAPFDCVLSDLHLPGDDGAWLLERIRATGVDVPVVVLTGCGDEGTAVSLMKAGAADYLAKDELSPERIGLAVRHALRVHRVEREARRHRERLALALEASGLGTWEWDPLTGVVCRDARCAALFGRASLETTKEQALADVHPDDVDRVVAAIERACDPGSDGLYRVDHRVRPELGERWVRVEGRVYFAAGRPVRSVGTTQDVTQERLEALEAQRRLELEQQLVGIVSHDLRNPVSVMILGGRVLQQRVGADAKVAATVDRIVASGERAARLIRDLLDFTQIRAGRRIPVARRPSDVHEVCRAVAEELAFNHPDRVLVREAEGDGRGEWDPDRVGQVIGNLLRNALAYSPPDSRVRVRTEGLGAAVAIEVHNLNRSGPIPAEVQATLFQPFQRGHRREDADRSVGLGLFIVAEIVSGHGGRIALRSDGSGTTFRVELPRAG